MSISIWLRVIFLTVIILDSESGIAGPCEVNRPVRFAGLDWDSARFTVEVARVILEKGYGCETESVPGSTLPLLAGLLRGDLDIMTEVWKDNVKEVWEKGLASGKVIEAGVTFSGANQGFFVPTYVIHGDEQRGVKAVAPDLISVDDLPRYAHLFTDPEEPAKGRFYNCIAGWTCENVNNRKFIAYDLGRSFTNFRPGTSAALSAAIESAYKKGKPVLFYYWEPTWLMGRYDMTQIKEPAFSPEKWQTLNGSDDEAQPRGCAYPLVDVYTGLSKEFATRAPGLAEFMGNMTLTTKKINEYLAYLRDQKVSHRQAALEFIKTNKSLWQSWVPEHVAVNMAPGSLKKPVFPDILRIDVTGHVNRYVDYLVTTHGETFDAISAGILRFLLLFESMFRGIPWWLFIIIVTLISALVTREVMFTLGVTGSFLMVGSLGLWDMSMQTLALMVLATLLAMLIGIPLGIGMAYSRKFRTLLLPVLDIMQTMPGFVYLIPVLMLFGLGKVPALLATLVYGIPPLIRMTDLGIRMTDPGVLEAAEAFGVSPWYRLFGIQLPLAMPNILAGINQTTMMCLSMVVIASMIGARGLGEQVLVGIQKLDVGKGLEAGVGIVALAIILDRLTQHLGKKGSGNRATERP